MKEFFIQKPSFQMLQMMASLVIRLIYSIAWQLRILNFPLLYINALATATAYVFKIFQICPGAT